MSLRFRIAIEQLQIYIPIVFKIIKDFSIIREFLKKLRQIKDEGKSIKPWSQNDIEKLLDSQT